MSLSINNNITALNAWRNLKGTDGKMSSSMEKLSSGLRINRAADDPAGLVISEKMRAQLAGLNAAMANADKAVNMVQTTEAALDKVGKLLVKIRQLALDSANAGINDAAMLSANQSELDEAVASITRIADYTMFGTKKLLDGSLGGSVEKAVNFLATNATFDLAAGTTSGNDGDSVAVTVTQKATQGRTLINLASISAAAGTISVAQTLTIDGIDIALTAGTTLAGVVTKLNANATLSGRYTITSGAVGSAEVTLKNKRWGTVQGGATVTGTALSAATSAVVSAAKDMVATMTVGTGTAQTSYTLNKGTGLTLADASGNVINVTSTGNTGVTTGAANTVGTIADNSAVFQIGPNETQTVTVSIQSTRAISLGKSATFGDSETTVTTFFNLQDLTTSGGKVAAGGGVLRHGTGDEIAQAIGVIDKAIDDVASIRGNLGAIQADNLQVQLDSLRVSYENLQASESTIRDADMTAEMATYTKYQIMMQAGTAMLAQANQMPNNILKLLQ